MPAGVYDRFDGSGKPIGTEDFRTAPGVAGSRWFSTLRLTEPAGAEEIIDISTDADWVPVRLRIGTPTHHLILQRSGASFTGALDDERLYFGDIKDFDYWSPVFNALTANRLRVAGTEAADLDVTWVEPGSLAITTSHQRYEYLGDEERSTSVGRFETAHWRYTNLDSGWSGDVWIAGAVVVSYPKVAELVSYEPLGAGPFPL